MYVNLVEHPARMRCGVELAATEFAPSYRRGTVMQVTLAALGLVSSIAAWLAGATAWWLVAGILLGSVIPFTLIAILPTNRRLLSPALDRRSVEAERLLARWNALHAVRSLLSGLALLLFLYLAIFRSSRSLFESHCFRRPPEAARLEHRKTNRSQQHDTETDFPRRQTKTRPARPRLCGTELVAVHA